MPTGHYPHKLHSAETKRKISAALKRLKKTPEQIAALKEAAKRYVFTPEAKARVSAGLRGKKRVFSETHRQNISKAHTGIKINPQFIPLMSERMRGAKHPNWKGGISGLRMRIRGCTHSKQWRIAIFERDNYTCVLCGKWGGTLNADHYPVPFAQLMLLHAIKTVEEAIACPAFWDISNGRTLCKPCHDKNKPPNPKVSKLINPTPTDS